MNNFYLNYRRFPNGIMFILTKQNTQTFEEYPGLFEDLSRMSDSNNIGFRRPHYFITKEQANVLQNSCDMLGVILRDTALCPTQPADYRRK